jgi:beta-phosphoglucomutase-like phosphatase (HAD superfamily)
MGTIGHRLGTARLVLFDIDGTLLRTGNRVHGRSIVQACQEITGHDITGASTRADGPTATS